VCAVSNETKFRTNRASFTLGRGIHSEDFEIANLLGYKSVPIEFSVTHELKIAIKILGKETYCQKVDLVARCLLRALLYSDSQVSRQRKRRRRNTARERLRSPADQ
jgi:hypothetical protein